MDERDFEGTLVLEQLAAIGRLEDFFDSIDSESRVGLGKHFKRRMGRGLEGRHASLEWRLAVVSLSAARCQ